MITALYSCLRSSKFINEFLAISRFEPRLIFPTITKPASLKILSSVDAVTFFTAVIMSTKVRVTLNYNVF